MFQRLSPKSLGALRAFHIERFINGQRQFSAVSVPKLIQQLRKTTGAPMMQCKKALSEADNDYEKAAEWLRKNGTAKTASKLAGRDAREGMVGIAFSQDGASLVRVASETDFASRSSDFTKLVEVVANGALASDDIEDLLQVTSVDGKTVKDNLDDAILAIRENLQIANADKIVASSPDSVLSGYVHGRVFNDSSAGTSAAIVELINEKSSLSKDEIEEIGKKLAMHIVAAKPSYQTPKDVPSDVVGKEKQLLLDQMADSGKPADIIDKIVTGRLRKFYEDVCLTEQAHMLEDGNPKVLDSLQKLGLRLNTFKADHVQ